MAGYNTKQRNYMIDFLEKNTDKQMTASYIADSLLEKGVGKSTSFRQIKELLSEGVLLRYRGEGKNVVYQYAGKNRGCDKHFHLKCVDCGRVVHLYCDHIDELKEHITKDHDFLISPMNSPLYGVCGECRRSK